jgi:hypothetical protein
VVPVEIKYDSSLTIRFSLKGFLPRNLALRCLAQSRVIQILSKDFPRVRIIPCVTKCQVSLRLFHVLKSSRKVSKRSVTELQIFVRNYACVINA